MPGWLPRSQSRPRRDNRPLVTKSCRSAWPKQFITERDKSDGVQITPARRPVAQGYVQTAFARTRTGCAARFSPAVTTLSRPATRHMVLKRPCL